MKNSEYFGTNYQRQDSIFTQLEQLTEGTIESESSFLMKLVKDVVHEDKFSILGGRIWELIPEKKVYILRYQYGTGNRIPDNYEVDLNKYSAFTEIVEKHTMISEEEDPLLLEKGIKLYSMAGVGYYVTVERKRYYKYIFGFNSEEITPEFYETLALISSVASIKLNEFATGKKQAEYTRDLQYASKIQRDLMPEHYTEFYDYKLFGTCIQSGGEGNVGGDYFDYFKNDNDEEERLGILIADAASKGLPAAIQGVFVAGAAKIAQTFHPKISALVSRLNTLLFKTFPFERPVSMFYGELCLSQNRLVLYANAGHIAPIHYRPSTGKFQHLCPTGGLMGILKHQKYTVENVRMLPDDVLVIFTDGITEATNDKGEVYGTERLQEIIKNNYLLDPKELTLKIIEEAQLFSVDSEYNDDKTVIVVKRYDKAIDN